VFHILHVGHFQQMFNLLLIRKPFIWIPVQHLENTLSSNFPLYCSNDMLCLELFCHYPKPAILPHSAWPFLEWLTPNSSNRSNVSWLWLTQATSSTTPWNWHSLKSILVHQFWNPAMMIIGIYSCSAG
jgi:hypothetical protein